RVQSRRAASSRETRPDAQAGPVRGSERNAVIARPLHHDAPRTLGTTCGRIHAVAWRYAIRGEQVAPGEFRGHNIQTFPRGERDAEAAPRLLHGHPLRVRDNLMSPPE